MEISAVRTVLDKGWTGMGPEVEAFEEEFAKAVGAKYARAFSSCTAALSAVVAYWKRRENYEGTIITSPLTFVSTAHVIQRNGYKVQFADVDKRNLSLSFEAVTHAKWESGSLAGVIPVCYGGNMTVGQLPWEEFRVSILFDCAHCAPTQSEIPSQYDCAWSFQAVKCISCGDGGMVTTNNQDLYDFCHHYRWLGINRSTHERNTGAYKWDYNVTLFGDKSHMNDISAAIGRVQLQKWPDMWVERTNYASLYSTYLSTVLEVECPQWGIDNSWHLYPIRVPAAQRNALMEFLLDNGIETGVHYRPLYLHPVYRSRQLIDTLDVCDQEWLRLISLPMWIGMGEERVGKICDCVKSFFKKGHIHGSDG